MYSFHLLNCITGVSHFRTWELQFSHYQTFRSALNGRILMVSLTFRQVVLTGTFFEL